MAAENGQHEYDELRWLARDTHQSRRRGIWLTAALTLGAIAVAGAYVSRNQNASPADGEQGQGGGGFGGQPVRLVLDPTVRTDLSEIRDSLNDINATLRSISPRFDLGEVNINASPATLLGNLVWLVEGSRRFPMAEGDVLWVPEANRWMRLIDRGTGGAASIALWEGNEVAPNSVAPVELPQYLRPNVERGAANCIAISSGGPSNLPGFPASDYLVIDVEFFTADGRRPCGP